jgi:uncharacterized protein YndB with AHSA1/START domain
LVEARVVPEVVGTEVDGHDAVRNFGEGMDFFGRYIEVTPPSLIVWTNEEGGEDGSVTTVTFEETNGRTLCVMTELYPSKEALDAAGTGAADATHETFAQLDDLLATRSMHPGNSA